MSLISYDKSMIGMWCILGWSLACSPRQETPASRDLLSLFPDATRIFGSFAIELEKSRQTNFLSQAKILVEQGSPMRVTLLLKMQHTSEQISLSFMQQNEALGQESLAKEDGNAKVCGLSNPSVPSYGLVQSSNSVAKESEVRSSLQEGPNSRIPLPLSIKEAQSIVVLGQDGLPLSEEAWTIDDGALLLDTKSHPSDRIQMQWIRPSIPENHYPLATEAEPLHLQASRLDDQDEVPLSVYWQQGFAHLSLQAIQEGNWLRLSYELPQTLAGSLQLPQEPLAGQFNLLVLQPECQAHDFLLEKSVVSWNCPATQGPLFSASYEFSQQTGGIEFSDWPELARLPPTSEMAFGEAGENFPIFMHGPQRLLQKVPREASRVCLRLKWTPQKHVRH